MFYSHTFLARKGPLGTVWCAAHLQHKLKKSHYTATDIPSTVERIMYPEVPIALRMSGHLLLGVVRIYSKKVDYLYQDCNFVLIGIRKAFASAEVNLPEDATHAPFHSVTLPDTFDLDAMDLDDDLYPMGFQDNHLKSQEEITLTDQIPIGRDPYVVITFDEVEDVQKQWQSEEPSSRPSIPVDKNAGFEDPGPSNQTGVIERPNEDNIPQNSDPREFIRENVQLLSNQGNVIIEPNEAPEQHKMTDKETPTPDIEEMLVPGGQFIPSLQHLEPPSAASELASENINSPNLVGHVSPAIAIRPTPPVQQPKARTRKRKQHYDESTVLTNEFMKKGLENSSDILRNRKFCACSALGIWKLNKRFKKDKIFLEPLMNGLCTDLCNINNEDFISAKPYLVSLEEACPEQIRNHEGLAGGNTLPKFLSTHSPSRRDDDFTPYDTTQGFQSDMAETTIGIGVGPTSDQAPSTEPLRFEMETPTTCFENTGLYDIPELVNSAEEDLSIVEEDDYTPVEFHGTLEVDFNLRKQNGTPKVDALSARTSAVARFLKKKFSVTPVSEDPSGDLSLNKILEGKRRKLCARMVYETLVLKNCGLVDVQQEEPYGDIILKATPKLSKEQFSS